MKSRAWSEHHGSCVALTERIVRIGNELADPDQAQAFMDRQFASASGATYDWIYRYDAMSAPL